MAAVASDVPIWFQKNEKAEPVAIGKPVHLVVADTGRIGDTHAAVKSIKDRMEVDPTTTQSSIDKLEEVTLKCRSALASGNRNLLGKCLDLAQTELAKLGVSDYGIDKLVDVARQAGALGAKLTGGGRGGCIIALAEDDMQAQKIANTLVEAGANKTWCFSLLG